MPSETPSGKTRNTKSLSWIKIITITLILVFYGFLLVHKIELPVADDMPRHIKNGEMILKGNYEVLFKNTYSYTETNSSFINHHWLSGVTYYLLFKVVGWSGLVIFKVIIMLSAFLILFLATIKKANFWLVTLLSIPTIVILNERTGLRPENFSYLFISIFIYLIFSLVKNESSKKIYWLIPIQLLWVNMHIFFFIGPVLVGSFLLEKIILYRKNIIHNKVIKKLSIVFFSLIAVCFLNPSGFKGVIFPFKIFTNYGIKTIENTSIPDFLRTTSLWSDYSIVVFFITLIISIISFATYYKFNQKANHKEFLPHYFFAILVTTILSIKLLRGLALYAMTFLPIISINSNNLFLKIRDKLQLDQNKLNYFVFSTLLTILLILIFPIFKILTDNKIMGIGLTNYSNDSAQFFKDNKLSGPIFNDFDIGSYLIYNFYPAEKVFVDNRPEAYTESFFKDEYFKTFKSEDKWHELLEKYNFNVIFFNPYDKGDGISDFLWRRARDPKWVLVYVDPYSNIFVRNIDENKDVIEKYKITEENVEKRLQILSESNNPYDRATVADTYNLLGQTDLGFNKFLEIVTIWPNLPKIWTALGIMEFADERRKNPYNTILFFEKAIENGSKTTELYFNLSMAYIRVGQIGKAKEAAKKILRINPKNFDGKKLVEIIEREESKQQNSSIWYKIP